MNINDLYILKDNDFLRYNHNPYIKKSNTK
jgi:hypothetical protein